MTNNFQSYAIALFDIAKDQQEQEKYYQQVLELDELNNANPEIAKILSTVTIAKQDRKDIVMDLLKDTEFDKNFIYWLWAIIDNNDFRHYHLIARDCRKLHHYLFNVTRIDVTTATKLDKHQLDKIIDFFKKKLNTQIDLKEIIKPDVIGGISIQINNKTYNNTIENKLKNLKQQLLSKKG